jgi:hypothetical protein
MANWRRWQLICFKLTRGVWGDELAFNRHERGTRLGEEALETMQTLGITVDETHRLVDYVYGRPVGRPDQELAGTVRCLLALAQALGLDLETLLAAEVERLTHADHDKLRKKNEEKAQAGVSLYRR